jgi:putative acetyltransferase
LDVLGGLTVVEMITIVGPYNCFVVYSSFVEGRSMKCLETHVAELREASRHLVRRFGFLRETSSQFGCTLSQCHALPELERNGHLTVCCLAELLHQDKSAASRTVKHLLSQGLVQAGTDPRDRRSKLLRLTTSGRKKVTQLNAIADAQVRKALELLDDCQREIVVEGVRLYAKALERNAKLDGIEIRPIKKHENEPLERLLRNLMRESNAVGPGYSDEDDELNDIYGAYQGERAVFFVAAKGTAILGGAGVAPLAGGEESTCELRKMYLVQEVRGIGVGSALLEKCLNAATARGFSRCYLETAKHMVQARQLYAKCGFRSLDAPQGHTGHFRCNSWAIKDLNGVSEAQGEP